jgi:hypothetical protein
MYNIILEMQCVDDRRYKYSNSEWVKSRKTTTDGLPKPASWTHPEGPKTGSSWMKGKVSFKKAKLTKDPNTTKGHLVAQSMHKYVTRIGITKVIQEGSRTYQEVHSQTLHLCQFYSVTAYQSNEVTKIKTDHNSFTKAFREPPGETEREDESAPMQPFPCEYQYPNMNSSYYMTAAQNLQGIPIDCYGSGMLSPPNSTQLPANYGSNPFPYTPHPSFTSVSSLASVPMHSRYSPLQFMQPWSEDPSFQCMQQRHHPSIPAGSYEAAS